MKEKRQYKLRHIRILYDDNNVWIPKNSHDYTDGARQVTLKIAQDAETGEYVSMRLGHEIDKPLV